MRVAALDIGTNTLVFLVAEGDACGLAALHDESLIVRLGEGVDRTGALSQAAMTRALAALAHAAQVARDLKVDRIAAVGTQALREAANGAEFLERARAILGGEVEVISSTREARLAWRAVASAFPLPAGARRTVLDIGGGSTELAVGEKQPERLVSLPIGAVRLTERLLAHDPPTPEEKRTLFATIDAALDHAPVPEGDLCGVAGTMTTLAATSLALASYDGARVHGLRLGRGEVERLVDRLGALTIAERRRLPGLEPRRADVIYAGGAILARVMARAPGDDVLVSDRGIRWGLAEEIVSDG